MRRVGRGLLRVPGGLPCELHPVEPGQCIPRRTLQCEVIVSDPDVAFDPAAAAGCPSPRPVLAPLGGSLCVDPGRRRWERLVSSEMRADRVLRIHLRRVRRGLGHAAPALRRRAAAAVPGGKRAACRRRGEACLRVASVGEPCSMPVDCETFYCAPTGRAASRRSWERPAARGPRAAVRRRDTFCDSTKHCRKYLLRGYGQLPSTATDQYGAPGWELRHERLHPVRRGTVSSATTRRG